MKNKGFTLIELLVVISIISLLSTIVLASLNSAREKAKMAAFVSEVKQFQFALELYKEEYRSYPHEGTGSYFIFNGYYSGGVTSYGFNATSFYEYFSTVTPPLIPTFISRFINFPPEIQFYAYVTTTPGGGYNNFTGASIAKCGEVILNDDVGYFILINSPDILLPYPLLDYDGVPQTIDYCVTSL